ncbi:MAG: hypothetical protein IKR83_01060 [Bacteroidales bacterium]|nr:hypothetical protein [Bacteroidales bacterium]
MKRIIILTGLCLMSISGLLAQNCEAIMLPYFGGNEQRMHEYPAPKFEWRCKYSQNAFYVADQVPENAVVRSLTEITEKSTGKKLTEEFVVDLETLSYYAYNFLDMQYEYKGDKTVICFPTPKSEHPYLVLRSLNETFALTELCTSQNK